MRTWARQAVKRKCGIVPASPIVHAHAVGRPKPSTLRSDMTLLDPSKTDPNAPATGSAPVVLVTGAARRRRPRRAALPQQRRRG